MSSPIVPIHDWQLALAGVLVLLAGAVSAALRLGLLPSLVWGALRAAVQLTLIGYVLVYLFRFDSPLLTGAALLVMAVVAAATAVRRGMGGAPGGLPLSFLALTATTGLVGMVVVRGVIEPHPWYAARIVIPIGGMILGNAMNAVALAWERLHSEVRRRRSEVEALLSWGATPWEAVAEAARTAVRAGMLPTVNSLAVVGLVTLPGMMTGQILAGADPRQAVRYQIVVMLMVAAAAALGCLLLVVLAYRRLFSPEGWLQLPEDPGRDRP